MKRTPTQQMLRRCSFVARNSVTTGNGRWIGAAVDAVVFKFDVFGTVVDWRTGRCEGIRARGTRAPG